jgi:hypothetical protein
MYNRQNQNQNQMSKEDSKKVEVEIKNLSEVELNAHESGRIIVTETEDGQVTISAKTKGAVNVTYLVGLLEVAKNDILNRQEGDEHQQETVDVVLEEIDFEMDVQGQLKSQGKKLGDTIQMPEQIAELRNTAKLQFEKSKKVNK